MCVFWLLAALRHRLNNLVDGRPYESELQPLWNANVAINNLTEMECDAEIEICISLRRRWVEPPAWFLGCGKRSAASFVGSTFNSEQAENCISDQRNHLTAVSSTGDAVFSK